VGLSLFPFLFADSPSFVSFCLVWAWAHFGVGDGLGGIKALG
jgi:hypothetical protein